MSESPRALIHFGHLQVMLKIGECLQHRVAQVECLAMIECFLVENTIIIFPPFLAVKVLHYHHSILTSHIPATKSHRNETIHFNLILPVSNSD